VIAEKDERKRGKEAIFGMKWSKMAGPMGFEPTAFRLEV
jgi:hypothetical protein